MQKLDRIDQKVDHLRSDVDQEFENFREDIDAKFEAVDAKFEKLQGNMTEIKVGQVRLESELKGEIKALEAEVKGIGKRLDTQEFVNRSVVAGFLLAIVAGVIKLFLPYIA